MASLTGNVHEFDDLRNHALGWRGLLDGLRSRLANVATKQLVDVRVDQVMEKFGGLCCYVTVLNAADDDVDLDNEPSQRVYPWIEAAENASLLLCYQCGPGVPHVGTGYRVRYFCVEHDTASWQTALSEYHALTGQHDEVEHTPYVPPSEP